MSDLYKISLETQKDTAQKIVELLDQETCSSDMPMETTAVGYYELPNQNWGVEAYFSRSPDAEKIRDYLQSHLHSRILPKLNLSPVANLDWVTHVQKSLSPVRCGRFVCYGSYDRNNIFINQFGIEINAGQAFGTSHHGTTRGCLKAIDLLAKKYSFERILDIGTGTGILAIAASKAWLAQAIVATDLDPLAVEVAKQNCHLNNLFSRIPVLLASGLKHPVIEQARPFDLILANILAGPLKRLACKVSNHLRPGGVVILSGILDSQSRRLEAHYRSFGFTRETRICLEGWTTLILSKS